MKFQTVTRYRYSSKYARSTAVWYNLIKTIVLFDKTRPIVYWHQTVCKRSIILNTQPQKCRLIDWFQIRCVHINLCKNKRQWYTLHVYVLNMFWSIIQLKYMIWLSEINNNWTIYMGIDGHVQMILNIWNAF